MSDFSFIFSWWLTIFLVGISVLPLTFRIFGRFFDKGYLFSKILGIVISSYIIWLLGSMKLVPFYRLSIIAVLIGVFVANLYFFKKPADGGGEVRDKNEFPWLLFIIEEVVFFICLAFWSYVRAHEPSIRGLEKFMDFGFVNSILRGA